VAVLALIRALWCVLRGRRVLLDYWDRATNVTRQPWHSCRLPYYGIAKACRDEGWDAPV